MALLKWKNTGLTPGIFNWTTQFNIVAVEYLLPCGCYADSVLMATIAANAHSALRQFSITEYVGV
ncbi:hypothetical protein T06_13678 [Trichinella sp. T6]|nr:hypothetical protein T06_13678 [Trichinella sp. T6]